ncbi:CAP domain-containing protein [Chloroflexota bacterium]
MFIILAFSTISCTPVAPKAEQPVTESGNVIETITEEDDSGVVESELNNGGEEQPEEQSEELPAPDPQPQEQPLPEPQPIPEEPEVPDHKYQELALLALDLINQDRIENGLSPVVMGGNTASQIHAEENLAYSHSSHWGMDGSKPYMRYTLAGGVNYVRENVLGVRASDGPSEMNDPEETLEQAQEAFMDSPPHRAGILDKWNKKVSLGIAYDDSSFVLVQHFEGDYIGFSEVPAVSGTILSMAGKLKTGNFDRIAVRYDPLPKSLSPQQLNASPYDSLYSVGELIGFVLPPLPPGSFYPTLSPFDTIGTTWDVRSEGWFDIGADISQIVGKGTGVYTIEVIANVGGEFIPVSNYSIFIQ